MAVGIGLSRLLSGTLAVAALAVAAVLAPMPSAQASPIEDTFSISVSGSDGNYFFSPRNAVIAVTQTWNQTANGTYYEALEVRVTASDGTPLYTFDFATPNGSSDRFNSRFYRWAQRYPFNDVGRPGIAVYGNSPCDDHTGSFEVRNIHRDRLQITSLSLVFERWCSTSQVDFGELRLGYTQTAYDVSPRDVVWPWTTIYPGHAARDVPIKVRLTSSQAVTVYTPTVSGAYAADFPIRTQNCTGSLTSSGCTIWVGFTPTARGPRHAKLTVPTSVGPTYVYLDGTGGLGASDWTVDVNWADPSLTDEHLVMDSASVGSPYEIRSQAWEPQPDGTLTPWDARFGTYGGLQMQQGTTYYYEPDQNPFYMYLSRSNGACEMTKGSVTLNDLAWLGPDRDLARMDALLTATCTSNSSYSVTARMRFHARADVTSPGRVSNLTAARDGGRITVTWSKPSAADLAGVIVRWYAAKNAPGVWWAGKTAYFGTGSSVSFKAPSTQPISISVWTYDYTGNVSPKSSVYLP
jgi:hypothetical protein